VEANKKKLKKIALFGEAFVISLADKVVVVGEEQATQREGITRDK